MEPQEEAAFTALVLFLLLPWTGNAGAGDIATADPRACENQRGRGGGDLVAKNGSAKRDPAESHHR